MRASVQFVSEPIEETLQSCLERINQLEGQIICSTKIQPTRTNNKFESLTWLQIQNGVI